MLIIENVASYSSNLISHLEGTKSLSALVIDNAKKGSKFTNETSAVASQVQRVHYKGLSLLFVFLHLNPNAPSKIPSENLWCSYLLS